MIIRPLNRPDRHLSGTTKAKAEEGKPAGIYEESSGNLIRPLVSECGQKVNGRNAGVFSYKTARKAVSKVNKKVTGHTYAQVRNQERDYSKRTK